MREWTPVTFADVAAVLDGGMTVICLVEGRRVAVPQLYIQRESEVTHAGDFGVLVIPYWLAVELELIGEHATPALPTEFHAQRA
jgi:hypothetical protein